MRKEGNSSNSWDTQEEMDGPAPYSKPKVWSSVCLYRAAVSGWAAHSLYWVASSRESKEQQDKDQLQWA